MARPRESGLTADQIKALSKNLKRFRSAYKSDTEMAAALGIAQPQLSQILSASPKARGAGVAVLVRLRSRLGVSLDDLLGLPPVGLPLDERMRIAFERLADEREARNGNKPPEPPAPPSPRKRN